MDYRFGAMAEYLIRSEGISGILRPHRCVERLFGGEESPKFSRVRKAARRRDLRMDFASMAAGSRIAEAAGVIRRIPKSFVCRLCEVLFLVQSLRVHVHEHKMFVSVVAESHLS